MGVVAPNGIGVENFWESLIHGRSGVRRVTRFDASSYPSQLAAEVPDFDPTDYMDYKASKRLGRFAQFAFAASRMAIEDSGIDFDKEDPYRLGVFIGTAIGGGDIIESQHAIFVNKGLKRINPCAAISVSTHSASGVISCEFNLKGPNTTIAAGCNSGLDATYFAYNTIRLGDADVMIVGAGEAPITPLCYAIFCASGNLSRENKHPHEAVKPYDLNADGMILGEGGGVLILEELHHALLRGSKIYGEILGYSSANEAFDLYGVDTNNGSTMALNFKSALKKAKINFKEIDYINAHGNGILSYDVSETEAIKAVFGEIVYSIPVTSIKPVTGHSISVSSIWQTITSLLAIEHKAIPPTINVQHPDPRCDLDYVTKGLLKKEIQKVLINAHGFGGRLTALIVSKFIPENCIF